MSEIKFEINQMEKTVSVGVGGILIRDKNLLFVRRHRTHGDGEWSTPGGYLDFGESFAECARREIEEETGVIADDFRFLTLTNDVFAAAEKHFVTIWMIGQWVGGEPQICAPDEICEAGWFPLDALPSPLFPPFKKILTILKKS